MFFGAPLCQAERDTVRPRDAAPFDLTGAPTPTLPGGFSAEGLPIGIQLIAPELGEATLLRAGAAFQDATAWHRRHPLP
jgi:amidase